MTEQQASTLREQIATEMPDVQAEPARRGEKGWILKLKNVKTKRELRILHVDEWESIKMVWQI
jgi:hypothetical protein